MHILITGKAKLGQLYQCTPLIVGDKYTDCEIMSFLGAKLTKDYPEPFGPPVYVLSATPIAVMDALQERGFELKLSSIVDGYISWMMSKPMEKLEDPCGSKESNFPHDSSPLEPRNNDPGAACENRNCLPKNVNYGPCGTPQKNNSMQKTKSRENAPKDMSTQTVERHAEGSQTEKQEEKPENRSERVKPAKSKSDTSQPEKTKSDASQTEPQAKKSSVRTESKSKPKLDKHARHSADSVERPSSSTSDSEAQVATVSSDSSIPVRRKKSEKNVKRVESPSSKKKKKQSTVSHVNQQEDKTLRLTSEHQEIFNRWGTERPKGFIGPKSFLLTIKETSKQERRSTKKE